MGENKADVAKDLTVEEQLSQLSAPQDLTNGQIQWLFERMSSDDQKVLKDNMKSCSREMFLTRTLPISAAVTASIYFARKRMPDTLIAGPKNPWFVTSVVGVASLVLGGMLTFGTCLDRVRPLMVDMYRRYEEAAPMSEYDKLRTANRQGVLDSFENMHKLAYPEDYDIKK
ncbi:hypothetical protein M3Y97_01021800 [Aphelenchoides bicaudatus]|nr:hypothetical protein M3Y97_01021800 [Aphelenchoides bicaudatus]